MGEPRFDTGFVDDRHPDEVNLAEAERTYKKFGLEGKTEEKPTEELTKEQRLKDYATANEISFRPDQDTDQKRWALKNILKYTSLRVGKDVFKPIDQVGAYRIHAVFQRAYQHA